MSIINVLLESSVAFSLKKIIKKKPFYFQHNRLLTSVGGSFAIYGIHEGNPSGRKARAVRRDPTAYNREQTWTGTPNKIRPVRTRRLAHVGPTCHLPAPRPNSRRVGLECKCPPQVCFLFGLTVRRCSDQAADPMVVRELGTDPGPGISYGRDSLYFPYDQVTIKNRYGGK